MGPRDEKAGLVKASLDQDRQADGGKTLVLEDGGLPATLGLKVKDPFRKLGCTFWDPACMVDPNVDCSQQDPVYIITCGGCNEKVTEGPMTGQFQDLVRQEEKAGQTTLA